MSESFTATVPPRYNGKHPGGRPAKRTKELVAKLAESLAMGMPDKEACERVFIDRVTLDRWRNEDHEFCNMLKAARAEKMAKRIGRIDDGETSWQSSAWLLERMHPQHFARPEITMNVSHTGTIEHTVHMVAESELKRLMDVTREVESEVLSSLTSTSGQP